jgi:hypothetical protein
VRNTCTVMNCGRFVKLNGLCDAHRKRVAARGDVRAADPIYVKKIGCDVTGCNRPAPKTRLGLCDIHYRRRRAEKPLDIGAYKPRRGARESMG